MKTLKALVDWTLMFVVGAIIVFALTSPITFIWWRFGWRTGLGALAAWGAFAVSAYFLIGRDPK